MGNRAVITTKDKQVGVYLHWNGGLDSVSAFLEYCKRQEFRSPEIDGYGWARLAQIVSNYFGGGLSIGIDQYEKLNTDNYDNGVYIIENWEIIGREFLRNKEQNEHNFDDMIKEIDNKQPEHMRLIK